MNEELKIPKNKLIPIPLGWRMKFIESLYEPLKIRGEELEKRKNKKRSFYTNEYGITGRGKDTPIVLGSLSKTEREEHKGQYVRGGIDKKGEWGIFNAEQNESEKRKLFAEIIENIKNLRELDGLQNEYSKTGKTLSELNELETQINRLFDGLFTTSTINTLEFFKSEILRVKFKKYTTSHIVEPYIDYSYLFQRLMKDKMIHHCTHKGFITHLKDREYIKQKEYDQFMIKGGFRSLAKSYSIQRENNFNNIFQ